MKDKDYIDEYGEVGDLSDVKLPPQAKGKLEYHSTPNKDKELEELLDDIVLMPAEWRADDYWKAKKQLVNLIAQERRKAKIEVLEKPILLELHIKQSQDYKQGFRDAVEQVESYRKDKLAELKEDKGGNKGE